MNYEKVATVEFPEATGLNINMMPFVLGEETPYSELVNACDIEPEEWGKVCYLTISESLVNGISQRRGGVHTERHPNNSWGGGPGPGWGGGVYGASRSGGIYLASNLSGSTAIWDERIEEPGPGGDCSHIELGEPYLLEGNGLYWMTDATPHESLPCSGYRQFFRLVTSEIDVWYADHSTPGCGLPDHVKIIKGNKFE